MAKENESFHNKKFSRKEFLQLTGLSAFALSGIGDWAKLYAASQPSAPTLVHILLEGGPDFRHLMVPPPNSNPNSYGYKYWNNRVSTTGRGSRPNDPGRWQEIYNRFYEQFTISGVTFGVLKDNNGRDNANGWLRQLLKTSPLRVAIINNVHHSTSRDHHHSLLVLQSGQYTTSSGASNSSGWGGRTIELIPNARLLNFSRSIRPFCNTTDKAKILSFTNSRDFGLREPRVENGRLNQADRGLRAIRQYYTNITAGTSLNLTGTPYEKFIGHRQRIQNLTSGIRQALPGPQQGQNLEDVYPERIRNLLRGDNRLHNRDFARQIANLRDAFAVNSLINMRIASLNYGGWDSHKNQITDIEPQFDDLFGTNKALHTLVQELGGMNNVLFLFTGEFGRQLKSNGDNGTDHGRANTVIAIGGNVVGGIYGEMFPAIEAANDGNGKAPFDYFNRDIEGRTSFDAVFKRVADWLVGSDTGTNVFNNNISLILPTNSRSINGVERSNFPSGPAINLNFI